VRAKSGDRAELGDLGIGSVLGHGAVVDWEPPAEPGLTN
jgi:hypothetical protein